MLSVKGGLPTKTGMIYRGVEGKQAIEDIESHGFVRNAYSAGVRKNSRWGDRVFWSRGEEGKGHPISRIRYIIETPESAAKSGPVKKEDISGVYVRDENDEIYDYWKKGREENK